MAFGAKGNKKVVDSRGRAVDRRGKSGVLRRYRGGIIRYAFMPGIIPRIRSLGGLLGGFAHILAHIFRSARLLPANHPMLQTANIGRFGITDVISTAANNLVVRRENIDQIMIFGAVVLAMIMVVIQVVLIAVFAVISPASAAAVPSGMFSTPDPQNDVVFTFLQQAIGVPNFFNNATPLNYASGIATSLHNMLGFYSTAMMIIAVIIVVYYVITVVGESAQSGTPFGRRFNGLWAPIRLVLALGLLVPLGGGLNAAQYLVMYTAKMGSGLATQAWSRFAGGLSDSANFELPVNPMGITGIAKNVFLYEACMAAYNVNHPNDPMSYRSVPVSETIREGSNPRTSTTRTVETIYFYWATAQTTPSRPARGASTNQTKKCGTLKITPVSKDGLNADYAGIVTRTRAAYKQAVDTLHAEYKPLAEKAINYLIPSAAGGAAYGDPSNMPTSEQLVTIIQTVDKQIVDDITGGQSEYNAIMMRQLKTSDMAQYGWGNAATYYMRMAYATQKITKLIDSSVPSADVSLTAIDSMTEESAGAGSWFWSWVYGQNQADADSAQITLEALKNINTNVVSKISNRLGPNIPGQNLIVDYDADHDNAFYHALKEAFGIEALMKLYEKTKEGIFPMVLLTNIGTDLVTRSLSALFLGTAASALGAVPFVGGVLAAMGNLIFLFGFIGIGVGFMLAYLLPFMPFIYFFFAVVEWVMSVVEGLIGAPLWALAHLRIEGDGLPGPGAMNGYIILLGMLLRPILIVFGLIASYLIFNAGAYYLNITFGGAAAIVQDGLELTPLAFVAYLLIYAVICYNLGMVCFKLIDTIPQQSMRWLGQSNLNFNDGKPDPIGNAQQLIVGFGALMGQQTAGALTGAIDKTTGSVRSGLDKRQAMKDRDEAAKVAKDRHDEHMSKL